MNTTQKVARLKQLNRDDLDNFFERCKLAAEVMSDYEWIAAAFDGSDTRALDYLASNAFALVSGIYSVGELIATYKLFPERSQWEEYSCDLHVMVGLWRESRKQPADDEPKERTNWRKRCEQLQEENVKLRLEMAELRVALAELRHPALVA